MLKDKSSEAKIPSKVRLRTADPAKLGNIFGMKYKFIFLFFLYFPWLKNAVEIHKGDQPVAPTKYELK